jgi:hypothetical protein
MSSVDSDGNIVGVGFGVGLKGGLVDLERPNCLRLYVKKKRKKNSRARTRPAFELNGNIDLSLSDPDRTGVDLHGRIRRSLNVSIPTDIHQVGDLIASGGPTKVTGDPSEVLSGAIVRWRELKSFDKLRWGLVTVAHGFDPPVVPADPVDTVIVNPYTGNRISGKRLLQFRPPLSGFDSVLIAVSFEDLFAEDLIRSEDVEGKPLATFSQLSGSNGLGGTAFQAGSNIPFTVVGTVEPLNFEGVGTVGKLVHVRSLATNAFIGGTSGCVYAVISTLSRRLLAAAIQIGADRDTDYRDGYGQCLQEVISKIAEQRNEQLKLNQDRIVGNIEFVDFF